MHRVVVIGGGPAGLAHAFWRRAEPQTDVVVLERAPRPGGNVLTETVDGYRCEWGPQAVRPTPAFAELVAALGCDDALVDGSAAAKQRWVGSRGKLRVAPRGPGSFLGASWLSLGTRGRAVLEPFRRSTGRGDETVAEFVTRRFGKGLVPLADAMVGGIFAGDATQLEVGSAFPLLAELEREHGSVIKGFAKRARSGASRGGPVLQSFHNGMQELVDRLAAVVEPQCNVAVQSVARVAGGYRVACRDGRVHDADELVVATPSWHAADLLADLDDELAELLAGVPSAPVVSVYLSAPHDGDNPLLRGFGFLLDPREATAVLGVIYTSELFEGQAPGGRSLYRVMLGGARHPEALDASDAVLRDAAIAALQTFAGVDSGVECVHVTRIPRAIPQYVRGHRARLDRIDARLTQHPGLHLIGSSYRGVALGDQLARPQAREPELVTA